MDYYLMPSYYKRLTKVKEIIKGGDKLLNVGCGRGAYNHALKDMFNKTYGIDVNEADIMAATKLNDPSKSEFKLMDGERIEYPKEFFDSVICIDVLEHVKNPDRVLFNIHKVLKKNGQLIVSVPHLNFPWTYDPINKIMSLFNKKIQIGAYAFGHSKLYNFEELVPMIENLGFKVQEKHYLSHYLASLSEIYYVGFLQKLLKENASNTKKSKKSILKYDYNPPLILPQVSKTINKLDDFIFKNSKSSIGILINATK